MRFEITAKFVQTFCKTFQVTRTLICQVEIRQGFFSTFPFICFTIALFSNFLEYNQFNLSKALRTDIITGVDKLPSALEQFDEILNYENLYFFPLVGNAEVDISVVIHEPCS